MKLNKNKCLLVVLPYLVAATLDKTKKGVRSFLAFPYGVMTMASFVKKNSKNNSDCEILDLNTFEQDQIENELIKKIKSYQPNVIGYSMSFDVSFNYLEKLVKLIRNDFGDEIIQIAGGPAASTAYKEILMSCDGLNAVCWSEGELALTKLLDSEDLYLELEKDPWIQKANMEKKVPRSFVTDDLDSVIDIDYELVDFHSTRPGHDLRYALDDTLIKSMGWKPNKSTHKGLEKVTKWYSENQEWLKF